MKGLPYWEKKILAEFKLDGQVIVNNSALLCVLVFMYIFPEK